METSAFDDLTRNLGSTLTRRSALRGLAASAAALVTGAALLQSEDVSAKRRSKNKSKRKKNKQNAPQDAAPVAATVVTCSNLGTACGLGTNTLVCNCRLTKEATQTCANVVNPPNGVAFNTCNLSSDCPAGQICDFGGNVCRSTCQTA
ncbi:MAG TPA: twin-arginine translocation signal domain-containing protein [Thermomicrobiales bacterium]|nr:twin-arginine translocation signal domain-containing protein [Thermomicrobiales bacterium]